MFGYKLVGYMADFRDLVVTPLRPFRVSKQAFT